MAAASAESLPNEERLLVSADAAAAHYAWDEALETYKAIVRVFPDRRDVALKLIRAAIDAGRPKEARAALDDLERRTGGDSADPRIYLDAARVAHLVGETDAVNDAAKKAEELADTLGLPSVKAQALLLQCTTLAVVEAGEIDPCAAAQELFEKVGDRVGVIRAEGVRVYLLVQRGDFDHARPMAEHSVSVADTLGSPDARSAALMETTLVAIAQGNVEVWKRVGRESVAQADLGGNASTQVRSRINLSGALVDDGELEEGRKLSEEALVIARAAGMKASAAVILQNLVNYFIAKGEIARAVSGATEALSMLDEGSFDRAWALDALGNAEVEADSLDAAREHFEEGRAMREKAHVSTAPSGQNLGEVLLDLGDLDGALRQSSEAVEGFLEAGAELGGMGALVVLARVELARGEVAKAMGRIDEGVALARETNASPDLYVPVRMRALYLLGKREEALAAGEPLPAQVQARRYARLMRGEILDAPRAARKGAAGSRGARAGGARSRASAGRARSGGRAGGEGRRRVTTRHAPGHA